MERKEFIRSCSIVCIGGIAFSSLLESCGSAYYFAQTTFDGKRIVIKKTEFTVAGKDGTSMRPFILFRSEKLQFPICVYRISETEYHALYTECTHKGCEVKPQKEYLVCPCHGSEFTNKGEVQNPPAEQNLRTFNTSNDNENVYIEI